MTPSSLVIKIGGAEGMDQQALCHDLAAQWHSGRSLVVVHGGSAETDALAAALGHPSRTLTAPSGHVSRYTDRRTLEIFAMATARVNRLLVETLQGLGVNALGLSGADGRLLRARRKEVQRSVEGGRVRLVRDDWTGTVTAANGELLRLLLDAGYLPVIAPLAISDRGELLNVDGDRAAAAVAGAVGAGTLLLLSNVPGLLRSYPDEGSLVGHVPAHGVEEALGWAQGRMKRKVLGAGEALTAGVPTVVIGDGRRAAPVGDALAGHGTVLGTPLAGAGPA
ncbi:[LysW]-aminoadipate kinase [Deinococcus sp. SDU3-2]|uniref:[LysW]-aminoadipate kinase n=1 Tax=Deinococcus terrestris TaxID=2651870 RepID=A0A7X1NV87_9DEIO|nr:[LysW]-aminoadipate kinase [Deinococcus terrestris]MPY66435.1 [LysW]-aminoadipate kinase [Deinococcus terrestris]